MELKIDKEVQRLIPPLQDHEFSQLEENVLAEGCREAIIIWNGVILDGHNRYKICTAHNIPFRTHQMDFESRDDATIWIIKNQFGRRNLIPFQRAELALKLKPLVAAKAKENQKLSDGRGKEKGFQNSGNLNEVHTAKEIAKAAGVSHDTIHRVETIEREGTPEQIERARTGGKGNSVNAIFTEIVRRNKPERTCVRCGETLPADRFYADKNICKACQDRDKKSGGLRGRAEANKIEAVHTSHLVDSKNNAVESTYGIEDLAEELAGSVRSFVKSVNLALNVHQDVIGPGGNQHILSALEAAEQEIRKIKERLQYEQREL